jgi:hypothetical protein
MFARKLALSAIAFVALASPTAAKDMAGRFALGFYNSDAPVGVRYWATDVVAVDVGVGFQANDLDTATTTNFWLEAAIPIKVFEGDRSHFYVRPGVVFGVLDDRDFGTGTLDEKWTSIDFTGALGAEVFFGEHFSVEASHGVVLNYLSPPKQVSSDSRINFRTFGNGLTQVGFRFYF